MGHDLEESEQFCVYLRDTFDTLYPDRLEGRPQMMSVGPHGRLSGRPGRVVGLLRFLSIVAQHGRVWTAMRVEVARHWRTQHPPGQIESVW